MTKEEWQSLQGCPGWDAMRRYLMDYRARIMEQWATGRFPLRGATQDASIAIEAQVRCEILGDLADMDWASIESFYAPPAQIARDE